MVSPARIGVTDDDAHDPVPVEADPRPGARTREILAWLETRGAQRKGMARCGIASPHGVTFFAIRYAR